jgi:spore germination protein KB
MSSKQAIAIIIMFLFGSSVVMGVNSELGQDVWIAIGVSIALFIPFALIYARIIKIFPGKDIYDVSEELFGRIFGKIIIILITWYAIHLGALVLRNFSEFIQIATLTETPQLIIMITMLLVVIYLAKSGVEVLGRWSIIIFVIVIAVVIFTVLASIGNMSFDNLLPISEHQIGDVLTSGYHIFSFPFAETILFMTIASSIRKKDSPYKIYLYAILIAGIIFMIIIMRNITVLGVPMSQASYFPSYTTTRLISISDFLTRIEGSITINFILAGITKITVCLIAASKGISKLFSIKNYNSIIVSVALIILALCTILYDNIQQMFEFLPVYSIYAVPFQIIIPLILWIGAERSLKKKKKIIH